MTVIARFEIIPVRDGSMSTSIAQALRALDTQPVSYQTTPTDTVIEAETVEQVFAALQAAHQAIPDDRVITSIEIDDDRRRPQHMSQRVDSVERALGHPPYRYQQAVGQAQAPSPPQQTQAQLPPRDNPPDIPTVRPSTDSTAEIRSASSYRAVGSSLDRRPRSVLPTADSHRRTDRMALNGLRLRRRRDDIPSGSFDAYQ